jgi:hypothetical protein
MNPMQQQLLRVVYVEWIIAALLTTAAVVCFFRNKRATAFSRWCVLPWSPRFMERVSSMTGAVIPQNWQLLELSSPCSWGHPLVSSS